MQDMMIVIKRSSSNIRLKIWCAFCWLWNFRSYICLPISLNCDISAWSIYQIIVSFVLFLFVFISPPELNHSFHGIITIHTCISLSTLHAYVHFLDWSRLTYCYWCCCCWYLHVWEDQRWTQLFIFSINVMNAQLALINSMICLLKNCLDCEEIGLWDQISVFETALRGLVFVKQRNS